MQSFAEVCTLKLFKATFKKIAFGNGANICQKLGLQSSTNF